MTVEIYTGHEQADNATMFVGGITFVCTVWIDNRINSVVAECVRVQEHGQRVTLFRSVVREVTTTDHEPDTPRILASGGYWVVHWLEGERTESPALHRATLNMGNYGTVNTWTYQGSVSVGDEWLYDHHVCDGDDDGDFVVAYTNSSQRLQVLRHDVAAGYAWTDTHWDNLVVQVPTEVLGVYADDDDNDVVVVWQANVGNFLSVYRLNADDGAGAIGPSQAFSTVIGGDFTQASITRYGSRDVAIVCEYQTTSIPLGVPRVVYRRRSASDLSAIGNEHSGWHLRMLSKPWNYAGARTDGTVRNVLVVGGFKHITSDDEWGQSYAFVLSLDPSRWTNDAHTVRPRIMVNINQGIMDARVSGVTPAGAAPSGASVGRRANHLSSAAGAANVGPGLKSRSVALISFSRVLTVSASSIGEPIAPMAATVSTYEIHQEDAWLYHRDGSDPAQPAANFRAAYPQTQMSNVVVSGMLVTTGGCPAVYDGRSIVELGYAWVPEIHAISATTPGFSDAGLYQYAVMWEWRDRAGRLHRSRPSTPKNVTLAADESAVFDISTMTVSMRDNTDHYPEASTIAAVIFRTVANGTIFFRLHASQSDSPYRLQDTPINDPSDWRIQFTDDFGVPDSELVEQALMPFQFVSGVLQPLPPYQPPPSGPSATWRNRVWLYSDRQLWYSNENAPEPGGSIVPPPEFHPTNTFRVDDLPQVTAMVGMDNALIVFAAHGVYALTGEGNNANGSGATLQMQKVASAEGCIEPRSVALSDRGVFYQSFKGYNLLTRTLEVDNLTAGHPVEQTLETAGNIRAATVMDDRYEIRLVINTAVAGGAAVLVYNYRYRQWSRFPLPNVDSDTWLSASAGGCSWPGALGSVQHVVLLQGGCYVERDPGDASEFVDEANAGGLAVRMDLETGWINTSGILGFRRLRHVLIQTQRVHAGPMAVDLYYDEDGSGEDTTTDTVTYSSPAPPVLRRRTSRQKYPVRIRVREPSSAPLTENVTITSFAIEVGIKKGLRRVPDTYLGG